MSLNVSNAEPRQVRILGVPIHVVDTGQALEQAAGLLENGPRAGRLTLIVTPNPEIIMAAQADPQLQTILAQAALAVPDGIGVVLAARILGLPLNGRVAGIELMEALTARAEGRGWRIYLLGATPGVADEAALKLCRRYPGLAIVGTHHGYFSPGDQAEQQLLAELRQLDPDLLFVGMGARRELTWLWNRQEQLPPCVAMGVGGSLDVLAGRLQRAPVWMRRAGLEWLFRLWQEPRRLKRVAVLPRFLGRVVASRLGLA